MKIAIHQPNFLPWLGYFDKIAKVDHFVFLDNVAFVKGHICNRNKIKDNQSQERWITVPVKYKKGSSNNFNELEIDYGQNWAVKILNQIRGAYSGATHFKEVYTELEKLLKDRQYTSLADLNITLIEYCCKKLNIQTSFSRASEIEAPLGKKNELNLDICQHLGADEYLSGQGAKKYNDEELYQNRGIELTYQEFEHPVYPQLYDNFIPNLSVIDLFLNCGDEGEKYLSDTEK